jgi:hypothetical protein
MASPTRYELSYDFTAFQASDASTPLPADRIEIEFNNIDTTTDEIIDNLGLIQRTDGALANSVVTPEAFSSSALALMSGGFNPRGDWADATTYAVGDLVVDSGTTYVCYIAHTSSGSLDSSKFLGWGVSTTAGAVSFAPTGTIVSTTVQSAIEELDADRVANTAALYKFNVSTNDTTPGSFTEKISAGDVITFTVADDGADETLTISVADQAVTPVKIDRTVNAIGGIGGGTQDINLASGRTVTATIDTSSTTFTFSNILSGADAFDLYLTNGGSQTITWPSSVNWAGGTAPTLTSSGVDHLVFTTPDGGTTWYGYVAGLDMS